MAEECLPMYRCGTYAPGWLNGSHPTVAEGAVTRKVCYHGWDIFKGFKCCYWSNIVKVKKCSGYYVYELEIPPNCPLRYCGNAGVGKLYSLSE